MTWKKYRFQILVALSANWGTINTGLVFGYTAVSLPQLKSTASRIVVSSSQASWIGKCRTAVPSVNTTVGDTRWPVGNSRLTRLNCLRSERVDNWNPVRVHTGRLSHRPVGPEEDADCLTVASNRRVDNGRFRDDCSMDLRGQILGGPQLRHDRRTVQSVHGRGVTTTSPGRVGRLRVRGNVFG